MTPARLCLRLFEARLSAKLSQSQAARKLKKPQSYISKMETGAREVRFLDVVALAKVYGKRVGWFAGESK